MAYSKDLPSNRTLKDVTRFGEPFPATRREIVSATRQHRPGSGAIGFLELFPEDEVFNSPADFIERCEQLKLIIEEERRAPAEYLRSPQE